MADWSLPTLSSTYANFLAEVKSRDTDLALQFDGTTTTNIPTGAIRWTSASNTWQKWTGSAWGALSGTFAFPAISVTGTSAAQYFGINATGTAGSVANGLFAPASNTLGFTTNATQRIHIGSSGDVGIGTASPGYRLDVQGGSARIYSPAGSALEIGNGTPSNQFAFLDLVGDTTYSDYGLRLIRNNTGANTSSVLVHRGTGALNITAEDAGSVVLATNNLERLRVDSSGNVGIGVSGPAQNLHIYSASAYVTTRIQSGSQFLDLAHTGSDAYLTNTAGSTIFYTGGSEKVRVDSSGNVGIGTSSPSQALQVNGNVLIGATPATQYSNLTVVGDLGIQAASPIFQFVNAAGSTRFGYFLHSGAGGDFYLLNQENGSIRFGTNNSERARIDSSGNVGIGTTVPGGLLEVSKVASGTLNGEVILQRTRSNASNTVFLDLKSRRHTAGSTWTGVGMRLQHQVDSTLMGHIEFNSTDSAQDVVIGTANTARFRVASDGSFSSVIPGGSTLYPNYACRAWVNFDGTTASPSTIRGSGNVSSVTKVSTGVYQVNYSVAMPDAVYVVTGSASTTSGSVGVLGSAAGVADFDKSTSATTVVTYDSSAENAIDRSSVNVAIFR
jgi:hypothetical protein